MHIALALAAAWLALAAAAGILIGRAIAHADHGRDYADGYAASDRHDYAQAGQ